MNYQLMRKARKTAKITQDDLAALLGVNRATISKYETGIIEPSITQQMKIARVLDIDILMLLDDESIQSYFEANARKDQALNKSGTIVDKEGAMAPIDSFIGQFMRVAMNVDNDGKLDLLMISEYFSEIDREDQKQMLRFASFLASNPKYRNPTHTKNPEDMTEAAHYLQEQLLSLMEDDVESPQEE